MSSEDEFEWVESIPSLNPRIKGPTMPPPGTILSNPEIDKCNWINEEDIDSVILGGERIGKRQKSKDAEDNKRVQMEILQSRELNREIKRESLGDVFSCQEHRGGHVPFDSSYPEGRDRPGADDASALIEDNPTHRSDDVKSSRQNMGELGRQRQCDNRQAKRMRMSGRQLSGMAKAYQNEYSTSTMDLTRQSCNPDWEMVPRFVHGQSTEAIRNDNCQICDLIAGHAVRGLELVWTDGKVNVLVDCSRRSMIPHQCIVASSDHSSSLLQANPDDFSACKDLLSKLDSGFASKTERHCMFVECCKTRHHHGRIRCYPLSDREYAIAPCHFKKAIEDCEGEWTNNIKLIEFHFDEIRRKLPQKLPYFMVSFGLNKTFAHVIEDTRDYSAYFDKEVMAGIFALEQHEWRLKDSAIGSGCDAERRFFEDLLGPTT